MQLIKQNLNHSHMMRQTLIEQKNVIKNSLEAFRNAGDSPIFLTKIVKLTRKEAQVNSDIKAFDKLIHELEIQYQKKQNDAVFTPVVQEQKGYTVS